MQTWIENYHSKALQEPERCFAQRHYMKHGPNRLFIVLLNDSNNLLR